MRCVCVSIHDSNKLTHSHKHVVRTEFEARACVHNYSLFI